MNKSLFERKNSFLQFDQTGIITICENYDDGLLYTIGIPTYRRAKDLKLTLESVLNQAGGIKFNLLIVDNNPDRDDETESLMKEVSYSHLSYYKNAENIGMCGNWNRLFQLCRTKYLIMLHDDDYLFPDFMAEINKMVAAHPDVSLMNVEKQVWNGKHTDVPVLARKRNYTHFSRYTNYTAFYFGAPSGCLFKVRDVVEMGGFNPDAYPSIDYVLAQQLCLYGKLMLKCKDKLMYYRTGANATAKLDTQVKWLDIDSQIKKELGNLLHLPQWYIKATLYFTLKLRLRGINKIDPAFRYNGMKGGGYPFLVFYKMWRYIHMWYFNL